MDGDLSVVDDGSGNERLSRDWRSECLLMRQSEMPPRLTNQLGASGAGRIARFGGAVNKVVET